MSFSAFLCVFYEYIFLHTCVCARTNLQRGRQYAEAVQTLVELRVGGPPQEGLPELRLAFALRPAAERTHPALLARSEQVAQGRALAAAFAQSERKDSAAHLVVNLNPPSLSHSQDLKWKAEELSETSTPQHYAA